MALQVLRDDRSPLDAHLDLEGADIVFHAHGGSGDKVVNGDYDLALRLVLERIVKSSLEITGAWVDSSTVQGLPLKEREILTSAEMAGGAERAYSLLKSRMPKIGRSAGAKGPGNPTKRIRIRLVADRSPDEVRQALGVQAVNKDFRSQKRLPVEELQKVSSDHVWNAVKRLLDGYTDHGFDASKDFDLIVEGGVPMPPKAVFGVAASEALGFKVLPQHFTGGVGTPCFKILEKAGLQIVPKGEAPDVNMTSLSREDREWTEGNRKLVLHLRRERGSNLARDKKAAFVLEHGKLYCERCKTDASAIDPKFGDVCIEVHHHKRKLPTWTRTTAPSWRMFSAFVPTATGSSTGS